MGLLNIFNKSKRELGKIESLVNKVLNLEEEYSKKTDEELRGETLRLKGLLQEGKTLDDILPEAFATVREAAWRVLRMKPYKVQVQAAIFLHKGTITELKTGEGKTLVATMPLYLNALEGKGSHLITVNDYLAKRDSEWMGKIYEYLGMSVGLIVNGLEPFERQAEYSKDITYATNNEVGFDYLRDNMVQDYNLRTQREFNFCIIDEVDSILIDEARTPLIISGMPNEDVGDYQKADTFIRTIKGYRLVELEKDQDINSFGDYDYVVEEKNKNVVLTDKGIEKVEKYYGIDNFGDMENIEITHYITRALKAHALFKRDIDYVVVEDEVMIVDENTGRIMQGRRYSEGIHQAIEAKEKVSIQGETSTLATISFQNLFKKYSKLSGMTGTAKTEELEFKKIYNIDVIEIPTNKPVIRDDREDMVFLEKRFKYQELVKIVKDCNSKGQPILVGTTSVEKSEEVSEILKKAGIKHKVLNAKYHQEEAKIIAQAGRLGAVTIATNMAGRGTDIILGGNEEYLAKEELEKEGFEEELIVEADGYGYTEDEDILAIRQRYKELVDKKHEELKDEKEKVKELGGLFILGTERYDSRRIDNQLRGRAGRQGDPGVSVFLLSLDDELLRLFGGERIATLMRKLGNEDEEEPLTAKPLSSTIESAQKKIEGIHYSSRKNLLGFDDVINVQREIIYSKRDNILRNTNIQELVQELITGYVEDLVHKSFPEERVTEEEKEFLRTELLDKKGIEFKDLSKKSEYQVYLTEDIQSKVIDLKKEVNEADFIKFEKDLLLYLIDTSWKEHMENMDELRKGIGFRAVAQKDPVVAYQEEGFMMFENMLSYIREELVRILLLNYENYVILKNQDNSQTEENQEKVVDSNG